MTLYDNHKEILVTNKATGSETKNIMGPALV